MLYQDLNKNEKKYHQQPLKQKLAGPVDKNGKFNFFLNKK